MDFALVLEEGRANGDIVSARKGVADIRMHIEGRAAHAGVEPDKGRSAVVEAAHKVLALTALNGRWPGVTVNVGAVSGGTRANVVAEHAQLEIDLRATSRAALEQAEAEIRAIATRSTIPDVETCDRACAGISGRWRRRPPAPRSSIRRWTSRVAWASPCTTQRPAVRRTPIRRRVRVCRRLTGWDRSVAIRTHRPSTSSSIRSCRAPRLSRPCCSSSAAPSRQRC